MPQVDVWPENWQIFIIFTELATQWRTGMSGATGLDYNAVKWLLELNDVKDHKAALADIRIMESAAINQMNQED